MIEVQLSEKDYKTLKKYASYSSDRTRVCAFRNELRNKLDELNINYDKDQIITEPTTLTIVDGNCMKLNNATFEILNYVGARSEFDTTVSVRFMHEIKTLIDNKIISVDDKFNNVYSPMTYRSKIKDLVCANLKFYGKGRLTDFIDPDATIMSLKFNDTIDKHIAYRQLHLHVETPLKKHDKERYFTAICHDDNNKMYDIRIFSTNPVLNSLFIKDNSFDIITNKIKWNNGKNVIYDPIILPKGLNIISEEWKRPKGRQIPADLWRNAYWEFMYRYELNH